MALNESSDNSVMGTTGSDKVPADGTGMHVFDIIGRRPNWPRCCTA